MTNSPGKPHGKPQHGKPKRGKPAPSPALGREPTPRGPKRDGGTRDGATPAPSLRPVAGERFPRSMRLRRRADFDYLFRHGLVVVDQVLVIHARAAAERGQLGLSLSKRVGNAPCRNRWKRLIREAYRRLVARAPAVGRMDLVIRPRRGATPGYAAIERSLATLTMRIDRGLARQDRS